MGAAHGGMLRVQSAGTEGGHGVHVHHFGQVLVVPDGHLLDLVGGAEAVEEVDEGHLAADRGQMGHRGQVHDLLHVALGQHGEAGLAAGHDVGVVAEDVQRVGGDRTGGDVEDGGQLLSRDLVHIGDHQQQALAGGVGAGESARAQGAVDRASGTGLGLHLDHLHLGAEDVLQTVGGPLVHQVGHGAGRGDGVDRRDFTECVRYVSRGIVAVHGLELSCHKFFAPPEYLLLPCMNAKQGSHTLNNIAQNPPRVNVMLEPFREIFLFLGKAQIGPPFFGSFSKWSGGSGVV